jgi:hypothetical protein
MRLALSVLTTMLCLALNVTAQEGADEAMHTVTIEIGDLRVIIGDDSDHGAGKTGYEGIRHLSHVRRPENVYVPVYAGLIAHRQPCTVKPVGDTAAEIRREGSTAWELFEVKAPHYVDYTVRFTAGGTVGHWNTASYMNAPEDPAIYLITTEGEWVRHYSPEHGTEASVAPASMTEFPPISKVENPRFAHGTNSFADSFTDEFRFDPERALYYGRIDDMVLIYMFEHGDWVIPYMSPSGGGYNRELDRSNPAWDFRYYMTGLTPGEEVVLRHRVVYKPFVSNEDVLAEYEAWKVELAAAQQ